VLKILNEGSDFWFLKHQGRKTTGTEVVAIIEFSNTFAPL